MANPRNTPRIAAAVALRRKNKKYADIMEILTIRNKKTLWRIFNLYAPDWNTRRWAHVDKLSFD
jgi:hypothetical protein